MNPFVSRITHNQSWVVPVSALSLVLGFMIVLVSISGSSVRFRLMGAEQRNRIQSALPDSNAEQKAQSEMLSEVNKLRKKNTELENTLAQKSDAAQILNTTLQDVKFFAGLTDVQGAGLMVTLTDSYSAAKDDDRLSGSVSEIPAEDVIHDQDVLRVVNELYAAGAEAVSINNLRMVGTSSVRCVGNTVLIDGVRVAPPIKIRAIGDSETLSSALGMPGGIIDELKQVNPRMVSIEAIKNMTLPGFTGTTSRRYAKVPKASQ
jgi:uncharacterized protein YlxW (UPF0749 family)